MSQVSSNRSSWLDGICCTIQREKSIFWHGLWIDCGKPRCGQVADIMRRTRAAYHYAIRRIKRDEQEIVKGRFVEAILKNDERDFWSETKRMRRKSMVSSNVVDGCCTAESIADYFANKYKELYSSVAFNYQEMSGYRKRSIILFIILALIQTAL